MLKTVEKIVVATVIVRWETFIFCNQTVPMIQALLTEPCQRKQMKGISFFFSFGFSNWDRSYSAIPTFIPPEGKPCTSITR